MTKLDENLPPVKKSGPPPPPPPIQSKRGPPPPPPGRRCASAPFDSAIGGKKLRKVHWDLIPAAHVQERTIFQDIQNRLSEFEKKSDMKSLQQQFQIRDNINRSPEASQSNSLQSNGNSASMKLALKRAQTIEIVLKSFKMSQAEICDGVIKLTSEEGSVLSDSQIQELLKCMPNEDEEKSLQAIVRKSLSGPAERFLLLLMSIPYVAERLQFGLFVGQFNEIIKGLESQIALLNNACLEVRNSNEVQLLFTIILHVGNILNEGTKIGNAKGFKISSLKQLKGTKTTDGNDKNLLHVILEQVSMESEEIFWNLDCMLPSCEKAAELSLKEMEELIKNTQAQIINLENFADRIDQTDGRNCGQPIRSFYIEGKSAIERVHKNFTQAKQDFKSLAEYLEGKVYGQGLQPTDLFSNLKVFKEDIKAAKKQIVKLDSRETSKGSNYQPSPQTSQISISTLQSQSTVTNKNTVSKKDKSLLKTDGEVINAEDLRRSIRWSIHRVQNEGLPNNIEHINKHQKQQQQYHFQFPDKIPMVYRSSSLDTENIIRDRRFARNIQELSNSQSLSKSPRIDNINSKPLEVHGRKKTQILNRINLQNFENIDQFPNPSTHSRSPDLIIRTEESTINQTSNNNYSDAKQKSWLTKSIKALKKNLCGFHEIQD